MNFRNYVGALYLLCFILSPFASNAKDLSKEASISPEDFKSLSFFPAGIPSGKKLPKGVYQLGLYQSMLTEDRSYVFSRKPLNFVVHDGVVNVSNSPDVNLFQNGKGVGRNTKINLLDFDEIWVSYQPKDFDRPCSLGLAIDAQNTKSADVYTLESSMAINRYSHQSSISLDGGNIVPRNLSYLINRTLGLHDDSDWRFVEERDEYAYSRLLKINLQKIDNIILEMGTSVKMVNFRLSRNNNFRPTDVLLWEDIPKRIYTANGKRLVSLDFASAIRRLMPESMNANVPINIVEMIAFIPKSASPSLLSNIPIRGLEANYTDAPVTGRENFTSLPAQHEMSGPGHWKWIVNLKTLQKNRVNHIDFLSGKIWEVMKDCVGAYKRVELVSHSNRSVPLILLNADISLKNLGVFDLNLEAAAGKIYRPKIISQILFDELPKSERKLQVGKLGAGALWGLHKLRIEPDKLSSLNLILNDFGIHTTGYGKLLISWERPLNITPEMHFSAIPLPFEYFANKTTFILYFSDGQQEKLPYLMGYAVPLGQYAGRKLQRIDLMVDVISKNNRFSLQSMNFFTIGEDELWRVLKDEGAKDGGFGVRRIKLGDIEYQAKEPTDNFWRDLANGLALANFGAVSWGGGKVKLSWLDGQPTSNFVKIGGWRFLYRGKDDQVQSWILGPSTVPNVSSHLKFADELYLFLSILVLLALNRWHLIFKKALLAAYSKVTIVANCLFLKILCVKRTALRIWLLIEKLAGTFICVMLWGATLFYFDEFPHDPLWSKLPYVSLNISLFVALDLIRRGVGEVNARLIYPAIKHLFYFQGSSYAWPPISVWMLSVGMFVWMLYVAYYQFGTIELFLVQSRFVFSWVPWLLSIIYGFLPWLLPAICRVLIWTAISLYKFVSIAFGGFNKLMATDLRRMSIIFILGIILYGSILGQASGVDVNSYILTVGNIIALIVVRAWVGGLKLILYRRWPCLASIVYGDSGSIYLAIALIGLFLAPILMLARLEFLSIQIMTVVYFSLVIGVVAKIISMRNRKIGGI
jgi:hypothetical protein